MYQVGDRVVYGVHGVCCVVELQIQTVNRKKVEYYVLEPITQAGARYYVPSHNEIAVSKIRPLLTKEELDALLTSDQIDEDIWIANENDRRQKYRQIIVEGDRCNLLRIVRTLRKHKDEMLQSGKKFHVTDANFLKDAEKTLYSELSIVLNIEYNKVSDYINNL